jgi:hypothetical protein
MITLSAMRFWIMDRTPADNPLEGDLMFTDEEILQAMAHAAREYNSIPPYIHRVDPRCLDDSTNLFFEATAEMLYKMKLHSLKRNAFEYSGGNVTVDEDNLRIKYLDELVKQLQAGPTNWRQTAIALKTKIDTTNYYSTFG